MIYTQDKKKDIKELFKKHIKIFLKKHLIIFKKNYLRMLQKYLIEDATSAQRVHEYEILILKDNTTLIKLRNITRFRS